eukprot:gene26416-21501_t
MGDYRLGDYAETSYFGPVQGPDGVWASSSVRWVYGAGGPAALWAAGGD